MATQILFFIFPTQNAQLICYQFKYTVTQRTEVSAKHFAKGLFGRQTAKVVIYPEPLQKDPILRVSIPYMIVFVGGYF